MRSGVLSSKYDDVEVVKEIRRKRMSVGPASDDKLHKKFIKLKFRTKDKKPKLKGKHIKIITVQKHLEDIVPSPVDIVFCGEELLDSGEYNIDRLIYCIQKKFPLYNIDKEHLSKMLESIKETFNKTNRLIIPKELLSLAMLNKVDKILKKKNNSGYFKTKMLSQVSIGRRNYATRFLHNNNYIADMGNVWKRTEKEFREEDFWAGNK